MYLRLEWESAVLRGVSTFQALEEERLNNLKVVLNAYLRHNNELHPKIAEVRIKAVLIYIMQPIIHGHCSKHSKVVNYSTVP